MKMKFLLSLLVLIPLAVEGVSFPIQSPQGTTGPALSANLTGRWRVRFVFSGRGEKNLVLDSQSKGSGSVLLLDTGPDDKPEAYPQPAAWAQTTNDRVSFSAEVELPIGTCCREVGTLIFKGKFISSNSVTGKVIFVGSTEDEENPIGFRSLIGTFTATRIR
jgi:hypothetical protein